MKNKSLIAMMFMTIFSFSLVGCNDQATQKSEPYIEDFTQVEYCEQIEPPVRMIEPASAINRATQCERESH